MRGADEGGGGADPHALSGGLGVGEARVGPSEGLCGVRSALKGSKPDGLVRVEAAGALVQDLLEELLCLLLQEMRKGSIIRGGPEAAGSEGSGVHSGGRGLGGSGSGGFSVV